MTERLIQTLSAFVVFALLGVYLVMHQGTFMSMVLLAAVLGAALILMPRFLLAAALISGVVGLKLPIAGGIFTLQHFLFFALFVYGILYSSIRKGPVPITSSRFLLGFGAVILLTIAVRGIGFRVFGSEAFGGADYLKILLTIGGFLGGLKVGLTQRQIRLMIVIYALGPLVPFVAQLLVQIRPSLYYILNRFIETRAEYVLGEATLMGAQESAAITGRIHAASAMASGLWLLAWLWLGNRLRERSLPLAALLVGAASLAMFSGFRGTTVSIIILGGTCIFFSSRRKGTLILWGTAAACTIYVVLIAFGPSLPLNAQRALSFVPGVNWDAGVRRDAARSITWRLEVWEYALKQVPRYLVVGRGILLEDVYRQHAWLSWSYYSSPDFFYAMHSYHNGPLALLLDTGLLGLIAFFGFQVSVVREGWRWWKAAKKDDSNRLLQAALFYYAIRASYMLFVFYFLYGDIKYNIVDWAVIGLLLHAAGRATIGEPAPAAAVEAVRTPPPPLRSLAQASLSAPMG